jgi:thymidylate kinase
MIIELFGPPGVGKTTFARMLAVRLSEAGRPTQLVVSHRPAEESAALDSDARCPTRGRTAATIRRVGRPLVEMLVLARRPADMSSDVSTALNLVKIMPPISITWSIRLSQYLSRLSRSWQLASKSDKIVLFDQAFVQAVTSLMLLHGTQDEVLTSEALDCVPKADLLIRLDAPREVVETRLRERLRSQSMIERLFELDLKSNLELIRITDRLHELLERRGERVLRVNSLDPVSLKEAAEQIEAYLAQKPCVEDGAVVTS